MDKQKIVEAYQFFEQCIKERLSPEDAVKKYQETFYVGQKAGDLMSLGSIFEEIESGYEWLDDIRYTLVDYISIYSSSDNKEYFEDEAKEEARNRVYDLSFDKDLCGFVLGDTIIPVPIIETEPGKFIYFGVYVEDVVESLDIELEVEGEICSGTRSWETGEYESVRDVVINYDFEVDTDGAAKEYWEQTCEDIVAYYDNDKKLFNERSDNKLFAAKDMTKSLKNKELG